MFGKFNLALFLLVIITGDSLAGERLEVGEIRVKDRSYRVEMAITSRQRQLGLMFRLELADDRGMLLVYPQSGDHRVWMKNMSIALRVFWLDENFRVIDSQRLEPCSSNPCPVYGAALDSRYILELSDRDHPIRVGDTFTGLPR